MTNSLIKLLVGYTLIVSMLISVCGFGWAQSNHVSKEGDPTPRFSITTDHGRRVSPQNLGRSLLVLNFWETSCVPCVKELPSLTDFERHFQSAHVMVVAVSGDKDAEKYRSFLREHKIGLDTYRDPTRRISKRFGTYMFPETYIIQNGVVIRKVIGSIDWMSDDITSFFRARLD